MINYSEVKRNLFYGYDMFRILFNRYYNGHDDKYTEEELKEIKETLKHIKDNIKEIDKELEK